MPKRLEEALKRSARKRGITEGSDRWGAYVYGTLAKIEKKEEKNSGDSHGDDDRNDRS